MFRGSREQQLSWESRWALWGPEGLGQTLPSLEQGPWAKPTIGGLCAGCSQASLSAADVLLHVEGKSDEQGL